MKFKLYGRFFLVLAVVMLYGGSYLAHITQGTWFYLPNLLLTIGGVIGCLAMAGIIGIKNMFNSNSNGKLK